MSLPNWLHQSHRRHLGWFMLDTLFDTVLISAVTFAAVSVVLGMLPGVIAGGGGFALAVLFSLRRATPSPLHTATRLDHALRTRDLLATAASTSIVGFGSEIHRQAAIAASRVKAVSLRRREGRSYLWRLWVLACAVCLAALLRTSPLESPSRERPGSALAAAVPQPSAAAGTRSLIGPANASDAADAQVDADSADARGTEQSPQRTGPRSITVDVAGDVSRESDNATAAPPRRVAIAAPGDEVAGGGDAGDAPTGTARADANTAAPASRDTTASQAAMAAEPDRANATSAAELAATAAACAAPARHRDVVRAYFQPSD